jgi:hypothetical protein
MKKDFVTGHGIVPGLIIVRVAPFCRLLGTFLPAASFFLSTPRHHASKANIEFAYDYFLPKSMLTDILRNSLSLSQLVFPNERIFFYRTWSITSNVTGIAASLQWRRDRVAKAWSPTTHRKSVCVRAAVVKQHMHSPTGSTLEEQAALAFTLRAYTHSLHYKGVGTRPDQT